MTATTTIEPGLDHEVEQLRQELDAELQTARTDPSAMALTNAGNIAIALAEALFRLRAGLPPARRQRAA